MCVGLSVRTTRSSNQSPDAYNPYLLLHAFRLPYIGRLAPSDEVWIGQRNRNLLYTDRLAPSLFLTAARRAAADRAVSGLAWRADGEADPREEEAHRALNEQKQAIIRRAVTRGLDPNVKLKHSGIPWLGDVPEGWDVAALRHRYNQCLGKMLDTKRITGAHLLPYLRNTDVQWEKINVGNLPTMDISPDEYDRYTVAPGDLLVCEGGEVGRAAIWVGQIERCAFQKAPA